MVLREKKIYLKGIGKFGSKWGFPRYIGRVLMKNMSAQSSFCSLETTRAYPKPSMSPSFCLNFSFSSIGRLKCCSIPSFTLSTSEGLTPWFINCTSLTYVFDIYKNIYVKSISLLFLFKNLNG